MSTHSCQRWLTLTVPMMLGVLLVLVCLPWTVRALSPNQAGLVVQLGDGTQITRCVEFSEPEITGYELLLRSGLEVVANVSGSGVTMCSIAGEGCPANTCFCQCRGATCVYWSYWHLDGAEWAYSGVGASSYMVQPGSVDGWQWGTQDSPQGITFEQICAPAASTPAATSTPPPATPTPAPTATPLPAVVSFSVSPETIERGACAELSWQVSNVQAIYFDGESVTGQEIRSVCPAQTQTYILRVVGASGESNHSVTVQVVQPTSANAQLLPSKTPSVLPLTATLTSPSEPLPSLTSTTAPLPTYTPMLTATPTPADAQHSPSKTPSILPPTTTPLPTQTPTATPRSLLAYAPTTSSKPATAMPAPQSTEQSGLSQDMLVFGGLVGVLVVILVVVVLRKK